MISLNRLALALAATALAAAAHAAVEDTVAVVNGTPVMLSDYRKELSSSMDYWAHTEPEALRDPSNVKKLKETTLEELINRELLYQEGVKRKVKVRDRDIDTGVAEIKARFAKDEAGRDLSEEEAQTAFEKQLKSDGLAYEQFRERLSKQIMARKLIDQEVRAKVQLPAEKEVRAYFGKIKDFVVSSSTQPPKGMSEDETAAFLQIAGQVKAMTSERVRVSRILVKLSPNPSENEKKRALDAAQRIRKDLLAGTSSFAEIAKNESEDPESAPRGGDIGYVMRGVAPPAFEKAAFALPVGEISPPIPTEIGYNLIRVSEKRAAETPDFDKFKDDLAKFLANIAFQHELEGFVKNLKTQAVVTRNTAAIE